MAKVQQTEYCWNWEGYTDRLGYGRFTIDREHRGVYAHRVAYELHKGDVPDGMMVINTCGSRGCVNPAHLTIGKPADHVRRREARKRSRIQRKDVV